MRKEGEYWTVDSRFGNLASVLEACVTIFLVSVFATKTGNNHRCLY